ncbi:MAG: choice-of-anchor U domain-containing protein [Desulfamplus sp.]
MKRYLFNKVVIVLLVICFCLIADSSFAAPPTIVIISPSDNSTISYKTTIVFLADAKDPEDVILTGQSIIWMSDRDGFLGYGISFTKNTLSVGTHIITSTAKDSDGEETSASITVTVSNKSPEVLITSPQDNIAKPQGSILTFLATAKDPEDGILTGQSVVWESDRDGFLGYGTSFTKNNLTVGTHVITITATDSFGQEDIDSITVIIGNTAPNILITSPADNSTHSKGTTLVFIANATDPEDGILTGQAVVWKSDKDGFIGYGISVTTSRLSVGTHAITVTATDRTGLESTETISITVGNASPEILIRLPAKNSTFSYGDSILFVASVTDREDVSLSGESVKWVSERDGFIGFGTSFSINALSVGTHVITVTAKDSLGSEASSSLTITINEKEPAAIAGAVILKPQDSDTFLLNEYVEFQGEITADEDGEISDGTLVWRSSLEDAPLGTGNLFRINTLKAGKHLITLTATDSLSRSVSDFIIITVVNSLPVPLIISPADGSIFDDTDSINFRGRATDAEDGELTSTSLSWVSNLDGFLGIGMESTARLSPGMHTISFIAKDRHGGEALSTISLTVNATDQSQPMTLEANRVSLYMGQASTLSISGGRPPYRYYRDYPHIAAMDIEGKDQGYEIRLMPESLGETTFQIFDHDNTTRILHVTVVEGMKDTPFAHAGSDQTVVEGSTVTLDGTASLPGSHGISSWQWKQLTPDNIEAVVMSHSSTAITTFIAPRADFMSQLTFRLSIGDTSGNVSHDDVTINVEPNGISGYPEDVISFPTADASASLGVSLAGKGDFVAIIPKYEQFITEKTGRPENMLYGLLDLRIKVDQGAQADMVLYFPSPLENGYTLYKYSPSNGWYDYSGHVTFSADRTRAYVILRDGGAGDDDGIPDGMISDPMAIGKVPASPPPLYPENPEPPPDTGGDDGGGGGCFISTLL